MPHFAHLYDGIIKVGAHCISRKPKDGSDWDAHGEPTEGMFCCSLCSLTVGCGLGFSPGRRLAL